MIELNREQIKKLESLRVGLVYLFGSYAENKSSPLSDVDIGIVFTANHYPEKNNGDVYNELFFLFTDVFPGKNLDIVFLQNASLELRSDVVRHGKNIYRISENVKSDFEDTVSMLYMDFKPILNEFDKAIMKRI